MYESEIIKNAVDSIPVDSKIFITKLGSITDRIEQLLIDKNWTQKDLAIKMNKKESEINKWFTTIHNFTLRDICKIESIFQTDIIKIIL